MEAMKRQTATSEDLRCGCLPFCAWLMLRRGCGYQQCQNDGNKHENGNNKICLLVKIAIIRFVYYLIL